MTEEQKQFARKIATLLDDLHSIAMHERFVRIYPKELLQEKLELVLTRPNINNKGAYYRTLVTSHGGTRNSRY